MRKTKKLTILIWSLIMSSIVGMFALYPVIYDRAETNYKADIHNAESKQTGIYADSSFLQEEIMRISFPIYINFWKTTDVNFLPSDLLTGSRSADDTAMLSNLIQEEQLYYFQNYSKVRFYVRNEQGNIYANDESLVRYLEPNYQSDEKVWHSAFKYDSVGQFNIISTNSNQPLTNADGNSIIIDKLNNNGITNGLSAKKNMIFIFEVREGDIVEPYDLERLTYHIDDYLYFSLQNLYSGICLLIVLIMFCIPLRKAKESKLVKYFLYEIPADFTILSCFIIYACIMGNGPSMYAELWNGGFIVLMAMLLAGFMSMIMVVFLVKSLFDKEILKEIKGKSILWRSGSKIKKICKKFYHYATTLNLSDASSKALISRLSINFMVASIACVMSVFGIFPFLVYTIIVFYIFSQRREEEQKNYKSLQDVIHRIAENDYRKDILEDLGVYKPLKEDIEKVQDNFHDAVVQEVRSQNMKTELITNVSHDLKTPLTSIISYIDLLKKSDITMEDRLKYIDILEKNSNRLKHLIENLFEISKANSGNVTLDYMDVDIVSLMKQVEMECDTHYKKRHLAIRNTFSEEKIILSLDSLKTFRIFENLISNAGKYAMPKTRIYVTIEDFGEFVEVIIKNISASELDFDPEGIMERFTRGDKSRNTEGSGLGLAIAKSFTELQGGTMHITFDGDLFKVTIRLRKIKNK